MMQICDFDGSRKVGKPVGWNDELDGECLDIFICDSVDLLSGLTVQYTVFKLSDEELDALRDGGALRLGIVGMKRHPIFNLGVLGPVAAASANLKPCGVLGGVVAP